MKKVKALLPLSCCLAGISVGLLLAASIRSEAQPLPNKIEPLKPAPLKEPSVNSFTMTCPGLLSNGVRFMILYNRIGGFNRGIFTIPSGASKMTYLSYKGKTEAHYDIWEGPLGESKVRVDHLSTSSPKPGDKLYVKFNQFSGRSTCR
jgi:hypothetical protein